jgi:hypothetical protein
VPNRPLNLESLKYENKDGSLSVVRLLALSIWLPNCQINKRTNHKKKQGCSREQTRERVPSQGNLDLKLYLLRSKLRVFLKSSKLKKAAPQNNGRTPYTLTG